MNGRSAFGKQQWLILMAALCSIVLTASLGAWQLRRAAYKEQLAAQIQQREQLPPLSGPVLRSLASASNTEHAAAWLQRRVQVQGRWRHEYTVYLDNRPMQVAGSQRVGFYVLTPLQLDGGEDLIWVQRGWVQRDFQDRTRLPSLPDVTTTVAVSGRLIAEASRAYEMSNPAPAQAASPDTRASRIWQNLPSTWLPSANTLPMVLLQTEPEMAQDDLQRNWPAPDTGVAKHHGYAFQWFALSALLVVLYVWFQLIAPRRRARLPSA